MNPEECIRFVPSRVEGMADVTEVTIWPDRMQLLSSRGAVVVQFKDIADPERTIADRDWFHPPPDRYFAFYTRPRVVLYMPKDDPMDFMDSTFGRLHLMLMAGSFNTFDLG